MHIIPLLIISIIVIVTVLSVFGFLGENSFFALGGVSDIRIEQSSAPVLESGSQESSFLTDSLGRALYVTTKEECVDECLTNWPPYLVDGKFKTDGKLGVIIRDDLRRAQYTWDGEPLYYYAGDLKRGDTKGHEFGGVWFLARP